MIWNKKWILLLLTTIFGLSNSLAQNQFYTVNGNATQDDCNCYTLTPNQNTMSGSVWNNTKISLANSFDFNFTIYLGNDDGGADGIAFVLQPISTSQGSGGGGLGYQGISPSVAVTIDTYQNASDPVYDHIAIQKNGDIDHSTANNLDGPSQVLDNQGNIEDGQMHTLRVTWDATSKTLSAYVDGTLRVSTMNDFVQTVFSNDPMVYWGFTGSTGGAKNLQRFCTQNVAAFTLGNQPSNYCDTATVFFDDQSSSSSAVASWSWNFGDGATSTEQSPTHHFSQPGTYNVKLAVTGVDGCTSDTITQTIKVFPNPVADFTSSEGCVGKATNFQDASTISNGNITSFAWNFGDGTGTSTNPYPSYTYADGGNYDATLVVTTNNGCKDSITKQVVVYPKPSPDFSLAQTSGCSPFCVQFDNTSTIATGTMQFAWDFGDGHTSGQEDATNCFTNNDLTDKQFTITLVAISDKGCMDTIVKPNYVTVASQPTAGFTANPTQVLLDNTNVDFTNTSSQATSYTWNYADGSAADHQENPSHAFPDETAGTYDVQLIASNAMGCTDTATATIIVLAPEPIFEVPNVFTPNGDGVNDDFKFVKSENVDHVEMTILNRWGEVVYNSNGATFSWNGKIQNHKGKCAEGVYFYKMKLYGLNNKEYDKQGYVQLIDKK